MKHRIDPEGRRLPIKLDSTSNGEFEPIPLSRTHRAANRLAQEWATQNAKRRGVGRRDFLISSCGAASTLLAFNVAHAAAGKRGGSYELAADAALDPELAATKLEGREFIFDVQGHYVRPGGAKKLKADCVAAHGPVGQTYLDCIGANEFIKDVFLDSDTDMMVLSFVPSRRDAEPLTIEEADATRRIIDEMEGSHRLLLHGRVNPNQDGDLQSMDELAERWGVSAWKTYTQWGPRGHGFFLTDEGTGIPFIEKARSLDVKVICIHKGIPLGSKSLEHVSCVDVGVAAKLYPDVDFLIYHSGWVPGVEEGPYVDRGKGQGIDTLVRSLIENGVAPNSNVYAELGSTWRFFMRQPGSAAHALGKLLKYVGEDNVLWGTDSIWYGSPQDQIQAFRAFQISEEYQEKYGYPAITREQRAKIFGLNAMRPYKVSAEEVMERASSDVISTRRLVYREHPEPTFRTHGPKTRREFLRLLRLNSGSRV